MCDDREVTPDYEAGMAAGREHAAEQLLQTLEDGVRHIAGPCAFKDAMLAILKLREECEAARECAAARAGADPEVRNVLLWYFGTTEPHLLKQAFDGLDESRLALAALVADLEQENALLRGEVSQTSDRASVLSERADIAGMLRKMAFNSGQFGDARAQDAYRDAANLVLARSECGR